MCHSDSIVHTQAIKYLTMGYLLPSNYKIVCITVLTLFNCQRMCLRKSLIWNNF